LFDGRRRSRRYARRARRFSRRYCLQARSGYACDELRDAHRLRSLLALLLVRRAVFRLRLAARLALVGAVFSIAERRLLAAAATPYLSLSFSLARWVGAVAVRPIAA